MLEYLYLAKWDQALAYLTSGSPPIYLRLVALNVMFLGLYGIRKAAGAEPMGAAFTLFVQGAVLCANLLVLYQTEVEAYLRTLAERI